MTTAHGDMGVCSVQTEVPGLRVELLGGTQDTFLVGMTPNIPSVIVSNYCNSKKVSTETPFTGLTSEEMT